MRTDKLATHKTRHWGWAATPMVLAAAAAMWLLASMSGQDAAMQEAVRQDTSWYDTMPPTGSGGGMTVEGANVSTSRTVSQLEEALLVNGSLRGLETPSWGSARGQALQANRALRDRFDYYLQAAGEASTQELGKLMRTQAERELGPELATGIYAIWERYIRLQAYNFVHAIDPADVSTMQASLQEHQHIRQQLLGPAWSKAFYGDDEAQLAEEIEHALNNDNTKKADADWAQRIASARSQIQSLKQAPHLSSAQRNQSINNLLDTTFPEPSERVRASSAIGL